MTRYITAVDERAHGLASKSLILSSIPHAVHG
jgi:hypothetical protein